MLLGKCTKARFSKREPKPHYWFILAESDNQVLAVNLTAFKAGCDDSCVFTKGEYPIITKKSYIEYSYAVLLDKQKVAKKQFINIPPDMFNKVLTGAKKSDYLEPKYQHLL